MSTTETGNSSSTESEVSGLDYEETQLTLAPPGGSKSEPEKKRGFSESIDLSFGRGAPQGSRVRFLRRARLRCRKVSSLQVSSACVHLMFQNYDFTPVNCLDFRSPAFGIADVWFVFWVVSMANGKAQVVGWPPVRSFRRNALRSCTYVKVAVDGTPYLRKVDLDAYAGYQQLLTALEEMFSCFTARNYTNERRLVDPVNGAEYVPTYEDKDGDWMLVGDVPWK
ncbi:hypothetical protein B296_00005409 [Ensete ventricosum]|uniref:Auxin-responsive protein n=1 Tax=Ensete ventricosum TaxID=4639 RepID=A0A426ZW11_ENSVE|nr:hypothetical protein B296_00005409 [Ensete ventricosum]